MPACDDCWRAVKDTVPADRLIASYYREVRESEEHPRHLIHPAATAA